MNEKKFRKLCEECGEVIQAACRYASRPTENRKNHLLEELDDCASKIEAVKKILESNK